MKKCNGCGATLQDQNVEEIGYSPKLENDLCQRCFRIKHYDDLVKSYKSDFDNYDILNMVNERNDLIIWVVDLFDFDSNIISGLNRHLLNKDIILVGTKRDLLPETLGNQKLVSFVEKRLKFYGISVKGILFTGDHGHYGADTLLDVIDNYRDGRDVIIMGQANVGKSTLINAMAETDITISRYPGTTLDLIAIDMDEYTLYDTPGLIRKDNMQYYVEQDDLEKVVPRQIKPKVFQIDKDTSFMIAGLAQVSVQVSKKTSVIFYVNDGLKIHRTSMEKRDAQFERELSDDRNPRTEIIADYESTGYLPIKKEDFDVVINGLGFVNMKSGIKTVTVIRDKNIEVLVREALV